MIAPRPSALQRIWSSTSTTTGLFLPFTGPTPTLGIGAARMHALLRSPTGALEVLPAFARVTDPTAAFPTALALPSGQTPTWFSADGWSSMDEFRDLSALLAPYRYVVFGLLVRLSSGSTRQLAMAAIALDLVPRAP